MPDLNELRKNSEYSDDTGQMPNISSQVRVQALLDSLSRINATLGEEFPHVDEIVCDTRRLSLFMSLIVAAEEAIKATGPEESFSDNEITSGVQLIQERVYRLVTAFFQWWKTKAEEAMDPSSLPKTLLDVETLSLCESYLGNNNEGRSVPTTLYTVGIDYAEKGAELLGRSESFQKLMRERWKFHAAVHEYRFVLRSEEPQLFTMMSSYPFEREYAGYVYSGQRTLDERVHIMNVGHLGLPGDKRTTHLHYKELQERLNIAKEELATGDYLFAEDLLGRLMCLMEKFQIENSLSVFMKSRPSRIPPESYLPPGFDPTLATRFISDVLELFDQCGTRRAESCLAFVQSKWTDDRFIQRDILRVVDETLGRDVGPESIRAKLADLRDRKRIQHLQGGISRITELMANQQFFAGSFESLKENLATLKSLNEVDTWGDSSGWFQRKSVFDARWYTDALAENKPEIQRTLETIVKMNETLRSIIDIEARQELERMRGDFPQDVLKASEIDRFKRGLQIVEKLAYMAICQSLYSDKNLSAELHSQASIFGKSLGESIVKILSESFENEDNPLAQSVISMMTSMPGDNDYYGRILFHTFAAQDPVRREEITALKNRYDWLLERLA